LDECAESEGKQKKGYGGGRHRNALRVSRRKDLGVSRGEKGRSREEGSNTIRLDDKYFDV
jgi:hypothetical protein